MEISVIVPVFNSEKYIHRCIDSVLGQEFSGNFEIIIVDDGSTDKSPEILKSYQEAYSSVRVVTHPKNLKQSVARKTGMSVAIGDYIMFLDSDDWFRQGSLEKAYRTCLETKSDIVVFNPVRVDEKGRITPVANIREKIVTYDKLLVQRHFFGGPGTKIVRRELTEDLISGTSSVNTTEDLLYAIEILLKAETICLLPEDLYVYFVNRQSVTWTVPPQEYLNNQILVLNELYDILERYQPDQTFEKNILLYIEKWIYLSLARSHLLTKDLLKVDDTFLTVWDKFPIMPEDRIKLLRRAMKRRIYCLYKVAVMYDIRTSLGLVYRRMREKLKVAG